MVKNRLIFNDFLRICKFPKDNMDFLTLKDIILKETKNWIIVYENDFQKIKPFLKKRKNPLTIDYLIKKYDLKNISNQTLKEQNILKTFDKFRVSSNFEFLKSTETFPHDILSGDLIENY